MKSIIPIFGTLILLFLSCKSGVKPVEPNVELKRKLFIIGGGDRQGLMDDLLRAADWKSGDLIAAVTLPSGWGDSAYIWLNDEIKLLTGENCLKFDSAAAFNPSKIDSLRQAKVIFISGGDQNRMMRIINGTDVKNAINEAFSNGALIAGTSAGASIMSEKMITGNTLVDTVYESAPGEIWKGNLELVEGLSLLDSVIIDQHFIVRSRYNRMLSAVIENPGFQCIGIDEGTAIFIDGDSATVLGLSQVVEIVAPDELNVQDDTLLAARNIHLSIYLPGEKFRVKW